MPMPCSKFKPRENFPDMCECGFLAHHHGYPKPIQFYACDICGTPSACSKPDSACMPCKRILAEMVLDRTVLVSPARNVRSVSPQADSIHSYRKKGGLDNETLGCYTCGQHIDTPIHRVYASAFYKLPANRTKTPLVSPERVTAIKAFRRSLTLLEEAYGVKVGADTDGSCDLLIVDTTRTLPQGYYYDARISKDGDLEFAEWVRDNEAGTEI